MFRLAYYLFVLAILTTVPLMAEAKKGGKDKAKNVPTTSAKAAKVTKAPSSKPSSTPTTTASPSSTPLTSMMPTSTVSPSTSPLSTFLLKRLRPLKSKIRKLGVGRERGGQYVCCPNEEYQVVMMLSGKVAGAKRVKDILHFESCDIFFSLADQRNGGLNTVPE